MTQYINLLNPALRTRREPLSLALLAITLAAISLVLAGAHLFARYRADGAMTQVATGEAQLQADQERLVAAGRAIAAGKPDPRLVAELDAARLVLRSRQGALEGLASGSLGNTGGFSEQFRAFARQSAAGLWLTGFTLSGAGKDILIEGRALRAELVPAYIRRLNDEPAFRGRSLATLRIEEAAEVAPGGKPPAMRSGARPDFVEFRLMSSVEASTASGKGALAPAPGGRP